MSRSTRASFAGTDPCAGSYAGAALVVVMVVVTVLSLVGAGLMSLASLNAREATRAGSDMNAFWAAEAGLQHVRAIAYKVREPFEQGGMIGSSVVSGATGQGAYSVDIAVDPTWVNSGSRIKRYVVTSTGTSADAVRQVQMRAETETFASYMHASQYEETASGQNIYFGPLDFIDGPVHVNDQINIYGRPTFLGSVRSAASSVNYRNGGDETVFQAGLELNAPALDFAGQFSSDHIDRIAGIAGNGGLRLTGDRRLTFLDDGGIRVEQRVGSAWGGATTSRVAELNGAIYVDGDAYVSGVLDGDVTVAAEGSIRIVDDIVYESAMSPAPHEPGFVLDAVDDTLGLMARDSVLVETHDDVRIHAAILVTEGDDGFGATSRYSDLGQPAIILMGSIAQYRRGVVGTVSGLGFVKSYMYDSRFLDRAPPHYPYSVYEMSDWSQSR